MLSSTLVSIVSVVSFPRVGHGVVRHYWSYSLVDANVCCSYHLFYPEDGRLEISNNCTEHSIKPIVMARKNWLLANTPSGA